MKKSTNRRGEGKLQRRVSEYGITQGLREDKVTRDEGIEVEQALEEARGIAPKLNVLLIVLEGHWGSRETSIYFGDRAASVDNQYYTYDIINKWFGSSHREAHSYICYAIFGIILRISIIPKSIRCNQQTLVLLHASYNPSK